MKTTLFSFIIIGLIAFTQVSCKKEKTDDNVSKLKLERTIVFLNDSFWVCDVSEAKLDVILIAGGGGGACGVESKSSLEDFTCGGGGGGGAGELVEWKDSVLVKFGDTLEIVIGMGGNGGSASNSTGGGNGKNTFLRLKKTASIIAVAKGGSGAPFVSGQKAGGNGGAGFGDGSNGLSGLDRVAFTTQQGGIGGKGGTNTSTYGLGGDGGRGAGRSNTQSVIRNSNGSSGKIGYLKIIYSGYK